MSRKEQLTLELPDNVRALKITGWRYQFSELKMPEGTPPTYRPDAFKTPDGVTRVGLFVAPPEGQPFEDFALFLAVEETPWLSEDKVPHLIFLGGFDHTSVALNRSADTGFLAFSYPCPDFENLRERIGSIDLPTVRNKPDA